MNGPRRRRRARRVTARDLQGAVWPLYLVLGFALGEPPHGI